MSYNKYPTDFDITDIIDTQYYEKRITTATIHTFIKLLGNSYTLVEVEVYGK